MTATNLLSPKEILWKIIATYGHDPEAVFARVGLTHAMLLEQGARIPHKTVDRLWDEVTRVVNDPCFGLRASEFWHPSHFNALGYAWLASCTLRQALERLDRYIHIISQATDVRLVDSAEDVSLTLSDSLEQPARMDLTMAIVVSMCRLNFGPNLKPVAVRFGDECPQPATQTPGGRYNLPQGARSDARRPGPAVCSRQQARPD